MVISLKVLEYSVNLSLVVWNTGCFIKLPILLPLHIEWTVTVCWEERWPPIGILVWPDAISIMYPPVVCFFVVSLSELLSAYVVGAVAMGREQDWSPVSILIGSDSVCIMDSPVICMIIIMVVVVVVVVVMGRVIVMLIMVGVMVV